ncbi:hypothetical protein IG631_01101 [Alternaria alternata]|nr:hypothetical protein IG631_01101 [Alternaria alternata]
MAKPSSSETVSFATHDYSQANAGKSSSRDKTGPRSSGTQSIKGYVYIDHPLVLPNEIFGDPTNLQNIIDGKRTRKASNLNESPSEKATRAVETKDKDKAKMPPKKPSMKLAFPAKTPASSRAGKGYAPKDTSEYLTSKNRGDPKSRSHNGEYDTDSFEENVSPGDIRRSVLALVKHSLRIADDVSTYMRCVEGHETHGQKLVRDMERLLEHRVEKRKVVAQEGGEGKVARTIM